MLLKSNQKFTRFMLEEASTVFDGDWRERLREALSAHVFMDNPSNPYVCGFVDGWDVSSIDFEDLNRWWYSPYVLIGFRVDRRSVPKTYLDQKVDERCRLWAESRGIEKVPRSIRKEFQDEISLDLLRASIPKTRHLQIVIDSSTGLSWLFGQASDVDLDHVRKLVFKILGRRLLPWGYRWWSPDAKEHPTIGSGRYDEAVKHLPFSVFQERS